MQIPRHKHHISYVIINGELHEWYYHNKREYDIRLQHVLDVPGMADTLYVGPKEIARIRLNYLPLTKVRWRMLYEEIPVLLKEIKVDTVTVGKESILCMVLLKDKTCVEAVYYQNMEEVDAPKEWVRTEVCLEHGDSLGGTPVAWIYYYELLPNFMK